MEKQEKCGTDRVLYYFGKEKGMLAAVTVTGILYNMGMVAGPYFEGQLAQCLYDITDGQKTAKDMLILSALYVLVILFVQGMRFLKRLYVRKFGNAINRNLKQNVYSNLIRRSRAELAETGTGTLMTKALSDADACAEGMRKFTTEVFDTGVVMVAYLAMLLVYDWRLTILAMVFPPLAYIAAELLKKKVAETVAAGKESMGRLNASSLERVTNAITYRVYGQEENRNRLYESDLSDYEQKAVRANVWETSLQPVYQVIAMAGTIPILWFGARNVMGSGWSAWNIAAFSTYLSCFIKLSVKASKAAKLFNAVQKARVSWKRIRPYLKETAAGSENRVEIDKPAGGSELLVENLSFAYPGGNELIKNASFMGKTGQVIGVTGPVACGKSTLGKVFLNEYPYKGKIFGLDRLNVTYLGHDPELFSGSIEENICLGKEGDISRVLRLVCLDGEVEAFPDKEKTQVGDRGMRLSGGQQARLGLARTLYHKESPALVILDDPFSAVDKTTEKKLYENLLYTCKDDLVILTSHRLTLFPSVSKVLWISDGKVTESFHGELLEQVPEYRTLYETQTGEGVQP